MRCKFVLDVDMHEPAVPESEKPKLKVRKSINRSSGLERDEHYFTAGTEYEHPDAWRFVNFGMADAADDECKAHAKPMTAEARETLQLACKADSLGIHDKDDRELFFKGYIAGYEKVGENMAYLPGPNYAAWQVELKATAAKTKKEESEI